MSMTDRRSFLRCQSITARSTILIGEARNDSLHYELARNRTREACTVFRATARWLAIAETSSPGIGPVTPTRSSFVP
jgi:hypothetical protein